MLHAQRFRNGSTEYRWYCQEGTHCAKAFFEWKTCDDNKLGRKLKPRLEIKLLIRGIRGGERDKPDFDRSILSQLKSKLLKLA